MKKLYFMMLGLLVSMCLMAQDEQFNMRRGSCMPHLLDEDVTLSRTNAPRQIQSGLITQWDANHTYRELVILVEFADSTFLCDNPLEYYDKMFNEPGFNEGVGPGCVVDYFRDQSDGLFNLQFDVYGPIRISAKACPNPNSSESNYHKSDLLEAFKNFMKMHPEVDLTPYRWDNADSKYHVFFLCASYNGNQGASSYGFLWPHSSTMSVTIANTGENITLNYSATAELWLNRKSYGIGTVCHEYCHTLGLPDIYPTSSSSAYYSVCDEWDLMDGGNFTNFGWCPPNLSVHEKMLMGWMSPTELDSPANIRGMRPLAEGGEAYIIHHTDNEFLTLENRQRSGWDAGLPGEGLLVTHIDYDPTKWNRNTVNNTDSHQRYKYIHADNLDYQDWDKIQRPTSKQWVDYERRLYNRHLSTTPYPWSTDSTTFVNDCLTDDSTPDTEMYNANAKGSIYLGKPIKNIQLADDGTISFDFMQITTGLEAKETTDRRPLGIYDLSGRRTNQQAASSLYIIKYSDGSVEKRM